MWKTWLAALAVAVLLALVFALPYGAQNQATYLLDPLHRAMPELYRRDWFVGQPPYLPVFGWLAQWLFRLDPAGPVAILTAHVILTVATYLALYWLVAALAPAWEPYVLVATFTTATIGSSMGASYLLGQYLQASSLATLGWIYAMGAFVRGRYLACGIALALAGAAHPNFLVLGIGLFALCALARRELALVDYAKLLAPQLLVLAAFLPLLLSATGPSGEALRILTTFHAPYHYAPGRVAVWIPELLLWQLAGFAALQIAPPSREARALWLFSGVSCAITVGSAVLMRYAHLVALTQLFCSRIAPFEQLACQLLVVAALYRHARGKPVPLVRRLVVALPIVAALASVTYYISRLFPLAGAVIASAGVLLVLATPPRIARIALIAFALVAVAATWSVSTRGDGLTTAPSATPNEDGLTRWAREQTPVDALFLIPPGLDSFRLLARRAVVVDLKSPPLRPDLLVAWYRRVLASVNLPDAPTTRAAVLARYDQLTFAELVDIAHDFAADYIVTRGKTAMPVVPVYANADFAVYVTPR